MTIDTFYKTVQQERHSLLTVFMEGFKEGLRESGVPVTEDTDTALLAFLKEDQMLDLMARLTIHPEYCVNVQRVIADEVPYYLIPCKDWVGKSSYPTLENFNLLRDYAHIQLVVPDILAFTLHHCLKNENDPQNEMPHQPSMMRSHLFVEADARLEIVQYCNNLLTGTGAFNNSLVPITNNQEITFILY